MESVAAKVTAAPPLALAHANRRIYASSANTLGEQLNLERDFLRELGNTSDYREAVTAFMEKRAPKYTGQ